MKNAEYLKFKKLVEHNFNFDTAGLSAYVDEQRRELLIQLQTTKGIAQYASLEDAVKGSRDLHYLDNTLVFQSDSCAYNASGTTTLTKKTLTVGDIAIMEDLCVKSLKAFWTEILMKKGSNGEDVIPAEINKAWMEKRMNLLSNALAVADWRADLNSGNANLNKYDGLLVQMHADGTVIDGNTAGIAEVTLDNVLTVMQNAYLKITEDMHDSADAGTLKWFLPRDIMNKYVIAGRNANLYHNDINSNTTMYHGTNIELIPQAGLAAGNEMVITDPSNLIIAVDDTADENNLDVWYSKDDRINHSLIQFKRGTSYKYGNRIVLFDLSHS